MFASVLLASRLDSNYKVSLLMLLAVLLFALFPILRRSMRFNAGSNSHLTDKAMTIVILTVSIMLFYKNMEFIVFIILVSFWVSIASPFMFLGLQKYKTDIKGPWDEANIGLPSSVK